MTYFYAGLILLVKGNRIYVELDSYLQLTESPKSVHWKHNL